MGDTRLLTKVARRLDPRGAEFWAMVYIGESVTDNFALRALRSDLKKREETRRNGKKREEARTHMKNKSALPLPC